MKLFPLIFALLASHASAQFGGAFGGSGGVSIDGTNTSPSGETDTGPLTVVGTTVLESSVTIQKEVQVSSGIYFSVTGSTIVGVGLSLSTSAQSTYPGISLDPTRGNPFFSMLNSSQAVIGGTFLYISSNDAVVTATTTTGALPVSFATVTFSAGQLFNHKGQRLIIDCEAFHSGSSNNVKLRIGYTTAWGTALTYLTSGGNCATATTAIQAHAEMTWQSAKYETVYGEAKCGAALLSPSMNPSAFADETVVLIFACEAIGVANGDISFTQVRGRWEPF